MKEHRLFSQNTTVDTVRLIDYLTAIADPTHKDHGIIALPPIQRSPVWKPAQIVDLWDSLLRGMPFGSFLVARMHQGKPYRPLDMEPTGEPRGSANAPGTPQSASTNERFFLLDGQQRTLAALLGYHEHSRARLWLDLGQPGSRGRVFCIRLTTNSQPFGFDPHDPTRKLPAGQKHDARDAFHKNNQDLWGRYDHQLPLDRTHPWKARLPVPMVELWQEWRSSGRDCDTDAWWRRAAERHGDLANADSKITDFLRPTFLHLDRVRVVFILVPDGVIGTSPDAQDVAEEDAIETLFQRVGRGGTPLAGEEHIFSLIKHRWPEAHDVVYRLYDDPRVGQLLTPTQIVMTAVRLARAAQSEDDVPRPTVKEFRRWLAGTGRKLDKTNAEEVTGSLEKRKESFLVTLRNLVSDRDARPARLHTAFARLRRLIDYRPANVLDPGFPRLFLPHLALPAMQVVVHWIDRNRGRDDEFFEGNRREILRFLLFWHVAVHGEDKAAKTAFAQVKQADFAGRAIYDALVQPDKMGASLAHRLPVPDSMRLALGQPSGLLRTWPERFSPAHHQGDARVVGFLERWWGASSLLLWLQRGWIQMWFASYDPAAGRDEDTPYDYDHIVPRDLWLYRSPDGEFPDEGARKRFGDRWVRDLIGGAIGNFRVWPSELNRSDGANPPREKLDLDRKPEEPLDDHWSCYGLIRAGDLLDASAISRADAGLWLEASSDEGDPKRWSYARVKAFQSAVEDRTAWLYERFYAEANFSEWGST